jgi:hypothetical protein
VLDQILLVVVVRVVDFVFVILVVVEIGAIMGSGDEVLIIGLATPYS